MKSNGRLNKINGWLPASSVSRAGAERPLESSRPFFDQRTFDELHGLLEDRMSLWLSRLNEQLETTFCESASCAVDREQLKRNASAIVSQAGMLGFLELADLCVQLEEKCTSGHELAMPVEKARRAAWRTREMLSDLAEASAMARHKRDDIWKA